MVDWDLYRTKLYINGSDARERTIRKAKDDFIRKAVDNPAYKKIVINGIEHEVLIVRDQTSYKCDIILYPDDEFYAGDMFECFGEHWIVRETRAIDTIQKGATAWMCNYKFKWQNFNSDIIEKWGVLDSGVYSTTSTGDEQVRVKDKQFKIYLPHDEDTEKIYIDKRIAIGTMYDKFQNKILDVYAITGFDAISESYGQGGHLLVLNIRSDEYSSENDNIELGICDYIKPDNQNNESAVLLKCRIDGRNYIRCGTSRVYSPVFLDEAGQVIGRELWQDLNISPVWRTSYTGEFSDSGINNIIVEECEDGDIMVSISDNESLIGTSLSLTLEDANGIYEDFNMLIDIVSI